VNANPTSSSPTLTGAGIYVAGKVVDINATDPAPGYAFNEWTATTGVIDSPETADTTFTMPDQEATLTANYYEGGIYAADLDPTVIEDRNESVTITIGVEGVKLNIGQTVTIENFDSINQWKTAEDIDISDFDVSTTQEGANINKTLSNGELELEVVDADIEYLEIIIVNINQSEDSDFWIGDINNSNGFSVQRSDTEDSDTFTLNIDTLAYDLRDIGPAGGHIFYIDEDNDFDWKYLEAAPEETQGNIIRWGDNQSYVGGTSNDLGKGKDNTQLIIDSSNPGNAAVRANNLSHGGYNDWFLPSYEELMEIYNNLHNVHEIGGFDPNEYWSSSETDESNARILNFSDGGTASYWKPNNHRVRAIRSF